MKKLVIGACALAAVSAMAVESANIVGYIEKDLVGEQNNDVVGVFGAVGGETGDATLTLGEIKGNADFSGPNGDNLTVYVAGADVFTASYFSRDLLDGIGLTSVAEGWWDIDVMSDMDLFEDSSYCYNNYVLPFGAGFTVSPSSDDSKLIFKGEVRGEKEVTYIGEQNNDTGNAVPVACVLGDIVGNADFSGPNGDNLTVYVAGTDVFTASYFSRDLLDGIGLTSVADGWWDIDVMSDMDLFEDSSYCYNNYALSAGQGFTVNPSSDDSGLIFPDPLTLGSN